VAPHSGIHWAKASGDEERHAWARSVRLILHGKAQILGGLAQLHAEEGEAHERRR
jgi:hypothetical protein